MTKWTLADIPDQAGKTALVTGANSGLGYWTALGLAQKNAQVVMACRSLDKGHQARQALLDQVPTAQIEVMELDLASLSAVANFAGAFQKQYDQLHILVNNAGVMAIPRRETADGFEMQFGVNHLAHFALTGHLINLLLATPASRIVTVSSGYHRQGRINFADLQSQDPYDKWRAYQQSKLANLLFANELQRQLNRLETRTISLGAHPGYAATNLQHAGPRIAGSAWQGLLMTVTNSLFAQSAEQGALPQLYAATAPEVNGCDYIGPDGFMHMRGSPAKEQAQDTAYDNDTAARLWQVSEELTGLVFKI